MKVKSDEPESVIQPVRLAFAGKMAAGKTSLARLFKMRYPKLIKFRYSDVIKRVARQAWGVEKPNRELCQKLGSVANYTIENLWDHMITRRIVQDHVTDYMIDGLRYSANFEWWKKKGVHIIYIEVSPTVQLKRIKKRGTIAQDLPHLNHASELCIASNRHVADVTFNSNASCIPYEFVDKTLDYFGIPMHMRRAWDTKLAEQVYSI